MGFNNSRTTPTFLSKFVDHSFQDVSQIDIIHVFPAWILADRVVISLHCHRNLVGVTKNSRILFNYQLRAY